jgi:hypothetical protein
MVGHLIETACHGFLYGVHYHCPLGPAVNLLSAAAKVSKAVGQGVHARRPNGNAQNCAGVHVKYV